MSKPLAVVIAVGIGLNLLLTGLVLGRLAEVEEELEETKREAELCAKPDDVEKVANEVSELAGKVDDIPTECPDVK